jgi:hypothetical protein
MTTTRSHATIRLDLTEREARALRRSAEFMQLILQDAKVDDTLLCDVQLKIISACERAGVDCEIGTT